MKILEPLVNREVESRFTIDDYAQWLYDSFNYNGFTYPYQQTWNTNDPTEQIEANFVSQVSRGLKGNGIVSTLMLIRVAVFSQARFQFRQLRNGRPGKLFGSSELAPLETPWPGGTTGHLLGRMILDVDNAGNFYAARDRDEIVRLRPDWCDLALAPRQTALGKMGYRKVGLFYYEDGERANTPTVLLPDEFIHWAPFPDPMATYRGMSWLTPVVREVAGDTGYTRHKLKFVDNAATPNLAVTLAKEISPDLFEAFVDKMDTTHKGIENAYKTLYLGGGADVTVVGANMRELDFKVVQGAGETRLAAAAGVGAVVAQFSEGLQGSALNAGNYSAARRRFADITMRHLWQDACGAVSTLVNVPSASQLWYDDRDIPFLQEDAKDAADIFNAKATAIRTLTDGGYDPESVIAAVDAQDTTLLKHSGLVPVQLQQPGQTDAMTSDTPADAVPATA
jgi:hypothetical protein